MQAKEIDQIERDLVLEAIHSRYGYDFSEYSADSIKRRIDTALAKSGARDLGEFLHRVLHDPVFFRTVLSHLTVKVTEMFRDPEFFLKVRTDVIPILRTYPQVKIWHAGCATGEEAYSMAILLSEEGLFDRSVIYATDIDASAIAHAKEGVYPGGRAELYARNYQLSGGLRTLDDYLTRGYARVAVGESLRRHISFFQHDLVTDFALGEMQMIFCRNVALYFTTPLRERVFELFAEGLCPGGVLCLGASETIPSRACDRFEEFRGKQRIFRKRGLS